MSEELNGIKYWVGKYCKIVYFEERTIIKDVLITAIDHDSITFFSERDGKQTISRQAMRKIENAKNRQKSLEVNP